MAGIARAYAPTSGAILLAVGGLLATLVLLGFVLQRRRPARVQTWGLMVAGLVGMEVLTAPEPAGFRMLALCAAMLYGMKAVVTGEARRAGAPALDAKPFLVFALLWFGMRPQAFHGLGGPGRPGASTLMWRGLRNALAGGLLIVLAHVSASRDQQLLALLLGMPGLSLVLHFGLFHVLSALWRAHGAETGPLFRDPVHSRTLREFWGRRWNLAFSEMTSLAVHRPLRGLTGKGPATAAAFLYSGLLHELAISLPVHAGWGRPLTYFALHGGAMLLERRLALAGHVSRLWSFLWVLAPLPLLFHGPFLRGVVHPLLGLP